MMKSKKNKFQRDEDELVGALLPPIPPPPPNTSAIPIASAVVESYRQEAQSQHLQRQRQVPTAVTAIPVSTRAAPPSNDNNDISLEKEYELQATLESRPTGYASLEMDIPRAPYLNTMEDDSPTIQEKIVSNRIEEGTVIGKFRNQELQQKLQTSKANTIVYQAQEETNVQVAKKMAKQRDREGLQITEDKYFNPEALKVMDKKAEVDPDAASYKNQKKGDGYEVSTYEVSEYKSYDYNSDYQYKSVYDDWIAVQNRQFHELSIMCF